MSKILSLLDQLEAAIPEMRSALGEGDPMAEEEGLPPDEEDPLDVVEPVPLTEEGGDAGLEEMLGMMGEEEETVEDEESLDMPPAPLKKKKPVVA
jgi:hypothetical protein